MVDAAHDGVFEGVPVLGSAVDGDCERLMASPASADGFDGVVVFDVRSGQINCLLEESFLLPDLVRPELAILLPFISIRDNLRETQQCIFHILLNPAAAVLQNLHQDVIQDGRWNEAKRMLVGDPGSFRSAHVAEGLVAVCVAMKVIQQRQRSCPHYTTAAAAIVASLFPGFQRMQSRQTGITRCATGIQLRHIHEPRIHTGILVAGCPFLRMEPIQIRPAAVGVNAAHDASHESPRHSQQDARSGEKGHLGVVGNLCDAMPVQIKACDALLSILLDDGIVGREFHRIAKGITDGPANHAAKNLILGARCKFGIISHGLVHHHYGLDISLALFVL